MNVGISEDPKDGIVGIFRWTMIFFILIRKSLSCSVVLNVPRGPSEGSVHSS
jgi:hypothetical protein